MTNAHAYTMTVTRPGTTRSSTFRIAGESRDHANRLANAALRGFARRLGVSFRALEWDVKPAKGE